MRTNLLNVGYMTVEMLETFQPYLDAANVDLKAFRESTYRKYVGARLQPVLDSLKAIKQLGIWLEVTTLVIHTYCPKCNTLLDLLHKSHKPWLC